MAWRIELTGEARRQLAKMDYSEAKRIRDFLRHRLESLPDPRSLGRPLKGKFGELWRYRVGNYRLICQLRDEILVILIVRIGKRSEIYR